MSVFSRAAAELMTLLTGDAFFPGGLGEFHAARNEFLVFEEGPSVDVTLQWATYRDASDQTSLSRIWGGIHPPADDIPGRRIGIKIGVEAFQRAEQYFSGQVTSVAQTPQPSVPISLQLYPNPVRSGDRLTIALNAESSAITVQLYNILGQLVRTQKVRIAPGQQQVMLSTQNLASGLYVMRVTGRNWQAARKIVVAR